MGHRMPGEVRPDPTERHGRPVSTGASPFEACDSMEQGKPETRAGGCDTEVVTASGHIVTRDEPRPAPSEGARPAEEPTGAELPSGSFRGSTGCAAWPSSR